MNEADIESYKKSIQLMQHALNNKIQEEEKRGFNVLDVRHHLAAWKGSTASGTIFRTRLISKERLDKMEGTVLISEFRYPPKSAAIGNKCNIPGQPIAYCASDFLGAVTETIFSKGPEIKPNYHFFVSEWRIANVPVKVFNTSERIPNDDPRSPDERDLVNEYLQTLEKCFTNPQGYTFSSQFAQNILFGTSEKTIPHEYDIIAFPSIARTQDQLRTKPGDDWNNYAIVPSCFDKYQFHRVYLMQTPTMEEVIKGDLRSFKFLLVGYPDPEYPGTVRWKRPDKSELPQIAS